jgi:hypothetical protein
MLKIKQIFFSFTVVNQLINSVSNCFTQYHNHDSTISLPISLTSVSLTPPTSTKELGLELVDYSKLLLDTNKLERLVSYENDLFLINKPSTYSKLLEGFINHHGVNSPKFSQLVSPEITLADRAFNIHLIMGDSNNLMVRHTLHKKESMNRLLDSVSIDSNTLDCLSAVGVDTSLSGVDNILTNHQDAVRLAIEIISS